MELKEVAGIIGGICFTFCYIPQMLKMWKNKTSEGVSVAMYYICFLGYLSNLFYLKESIGTFWVVLSTIICSIFCGWTIHLYHKYK